MFVDASVIVAILVSEEDANDLLSQIGSAGKVYVSAMVIYECALGVARQNKLGTLKALDVIDNFLIQVNAIVVPIDTEIGQPALHAFERYGKGRHPAPLNMGDCFAYASAKAHGQSLLFKGNDFALTDLAD